MTRASLRRRIEALEAHTRPTSSGVFDWQGGKWASLDGTPTPAGLPALPDLLRGSEEGQTLGRAVLLGTKCIVGIQGADL